MANTIRIKRRVSSGSSGAPSSLKNGELAYNESDNKLYYGFGDNGSGVATTIPAIAGPGVLDDYVDLTSNQSVGGIKTLSALLNANGGVAVGGSGSQGITVSNSGTTVFTVAGNDGDVVTTGSVTAANLAITAVANVTGALRANGGVTTSTGNLVLDSAGGLVDINDNVDISGTLVVGSTLNGHTIPGGTGTLALTSDALATTSGHNYITLSGQDIVQGDVALGSHTSGNYVATVAQASGTPGITITGAAGEGTATTVAVDSSVSRTTVDQTISGFNTFGDGVGGGLDIDAAAEFKLAGVAVTSTAAQINDIVTKSGPQTIAGIKSFTFVKADGISSKTDNGNLTLTGHGTGIVNINDNTTIGGTLGVTGVTTLTALVNANGGIAVDTDKFTVADATGNTVIAGTLGVTGDTSLGTVSAGTWAATDVAVLHGGTGASTAAAARTNLGAASATDNSTDVTLIAGPGYLSLSGQEITAGVVALSTHTSGSYVASLTEGTGVTITGNVGAEGATPTIAIGQPVATTDDVTFDNITATGYLRGPAVFTIDPAAHGDDTGKVVIAGNLQVDGITTTINSTTVAIDDKNLRLADTASTSSVLNGAGIELGFDPNSPTALASGALVDFLYVHADSRMVLSSAMKITGNLQDTTLADCIIDGGTF